MVWASSNDFWQEAGSENKTAEVCRRDYRVTFPCSTGWRCGFGCGAAVLLAGRGCRR